mgnify:CR=1 FL=1
MDQDLKDKIYKIKLKHLKLLIINVLSKEININF